MIRQPDEPAVGSRGYPFAGELGRILCRLLSFSLTGSPPVYMRSSGFLPDRTRKQAGGVEARIFINRKAAHKRVYVPSSKGFSYRSFFHLFFS